MDAVDLLNRFEHPHLIGMLFGGILAGIVGVLTLIIAVPAGVLLSVGAGSMLTWLGVLSGGIGFVMVVVGLGGYSLLWINSYV